MNNRTLVVTVPENLQRYAQLITTWLFSDFDNQAPWFNTIIIVMPGWPYYSAQWYTCDWTDPCDVERWVRPWATSKVVESGRVRLGLGIKSTDILEIAFPRKMVDRQHTDAWRVHPMNPEALARSEYWEALGNAASVAMGVCGSDVWMWDAEFMTAAHAMGGSLNRTAIRRMKARQFRDSVYAEWSGLTARVGNPLLYCGRMDRLEQPTLDLWEKEYDSNRLLAHPYQNNKFRSEFGHLGGLQSQIWYPNNPTMKFGVWTASLGFYFDGNAEYSVEFVKQTAERHNVWCCVTVEQLGRVWGQFAEGTQR